MNRTSLGGLLTFGESSMDSQFDITKSLGRKSFKACVTRNEQCVLKDNKWYILWVQVVPMEVQKSWTNNKHWYRYMDRDRRKYISGNMDINKVV